MLELVLVAELELVLVAELELGTGLGVAVEVPTVPAVSWRWSGTGTGCAGPLVAVTTISSKTGTGGSLGDPGAPGTGRVGRSAGLRRTGSRRSGLPVLVRPGSSGQGWRGRAWSTWRSAAAFLARSSSASRRRSRAAPRARARSARFSFGFRCTRVVAFVSTGPRRRTSSYSLRSSVPRTRGPRMIRAAAPIGGATPPVGCGSGGPSGNVGVGMSGESGPGMNGLVGPGTSSQPFGPGWNRSGKFPGEIAGSVWRPIDSTSAS